jgi:uncharacterized protein
MVEAEGIGTGTVVSWCRRESTRQRRGRFGRATVRHLVRVGFGMFGLQPRRPPTLRRRAIAIAQHLLVPTDWPANLAHRLGFAPSLDVVAVEARSAVRLGSAQTLKLVFAADFHAGPTTHRLQIDRAFDALAAIQPDLLLLGGDFVGHRPRDVDRVARKLSDLRIPSGIVAVLGNHDNHTNPDLVTRALTDAGVHVLANASLRLPAPFERTRIIGLEDHISGDPDASRIPPDDAVSTILLVHQPSGVLDAAPHRVDLALAGHTHGGQIVFPGGYAPVIPSGALSRRYLAGRFQLPGGGTLIVSRGVGTSTIPLRWNAPADLLVVTLRGADDLIS